MANRYVFGANSFISYKLWNKSSSRLSKKVFSLVLNLSNTLCLFNYRDIKEDKKTHKKNTPRFDLKIKLGNTFVNKNQGIHTGKTTPSLVNEKATRQGCGHTHFL